MNKPIDWYVKWFATIASLTLVCLNSYDYIPFNKYAGLIAALSWMYLGILWKEPAMWVTNAIFAVIYITGLLF
jgi:hypothetical protein